MAKAFRRTPRVPFDDIPGGLPQTSPIPPDHSLDDSAQRAIHFLSSTSDLQQALSPEFTWRDQISLTDTLRTIYGAEKAYAAFTLCSTQKQRSPFRLASSEPRITRVGPAYSWVDIELEFTTHEYDDLSGECGATVTLILDKTGEWKIWLLQTWLECFQGHGHPEKFTSSPQQVPSVTPLSEADEQGSHDPTPVFGAAIVGGGQAGLSVGGRLRALGVSNVLFETHPAIGGQWATRYDSLKWHTPKEFGHLPFGRTFLPEDDEWVPRERIGGRHREWAAQYGLNVQCSTSVNAARWDGESRVWTVTTLTTLPDSKTPQKRTWLAKHLILATGGGAAIPFVPEWATPSAIAASNFKGTIMHSSDYRNCKPWASDSADSSNAATPSERRQNRGIVVGTGNTAHDVAQDMADAGMHTTMLQRNATFIFPIQWLIDIMSHSYHRGKPTHLADREDLTRPLKVSRELANMFFRSRRAAEAEYFQALERAGFRVDHNGDLHTYLFNRFGGHYVDTGSVARIVNGEILMRQTTVEGGGSPVQALTPSGLRFEDGSELPADLIVVCTGFEHNFRTTATAILGPEIADQMDNYRGMDPEGEIRGCGKLAGHPNLFYFGGDARTARYLSRYVALQIQKDLLGKPIKPYED